MGIRAPNKRKHLSGIYLYVNMFNFKLECCSQKMKRISEYLWNNIYDTAPAENFRGVNILTERKSAV